MSLLILFFSCGSKKKTEEKIKNLEYEKKIAANKVDFSMPGRPINKGNLHPLTKIWRE